MCTYIKLLYDEERSIWSLFDQDRGEGGPLLKAAERRKKGEALSSSQGNIPEREHAVPQPKLRLGWLARDPNTEQ